MSIKIAVKEFYKRRNFIFFILKFNFNQSNIKTNKGYPPCSSNQFTCANKRCLININFVCDGMCIVSYFFKSKIEIKI
jgi:hypothetical protein